MNEEMRLVPFDHGVCERTDLSSFPRNEMRCISGPESLQPETQALVRCSAVGLRRLKEDSGSGLVEYGVVFVLFMTMILGIMDFGRVLYSYHFLSNVTREATRWAAVNGYTCVNDNSCDGQGYMNNGPVTQPAVQTYVKNHTPPGINANQITTTVTWPVNTDSPAICSTAVGGVGPIPNWPGCTVQVTSSYTFNFMFSWIRKTSMTLSSTSEMIISH
jgi:Flp pilus assembly protein TadG